MAELRPRVWVSQPLFDDIVGRLAAHFDVQATAGVTEHSPEAIAEALRDSVGALVTLNERIGPGKSPVRSGCAPSPTWAWATTTWISRR